MRNNVIGVLILVISIMINSCAGSGSKSDKTDSADSKKIKQMEDGTINLVIDKAFCYNNASNPSCNAAEWNMVVTKPGHYQVWLSSATIDTMDLQYNNSVKISLQDKRLDVKPVRNKIVLNATDVKYPYYRADSYIGEFYIQDAGEYSIQLISEKVIAKSYTTQDSSRIDHTKVMSVILTPMTR